MADLFDDRETAPLAPSNNFVRPGRQSNVVAPGGSTRPPGAAAGSAPDWARYGLKGDATGGQDADDEVTTFDRRQDVGGVGTIGENNEIFNEDQVCIVMKNLI
jgi:hypothetical protein